MSYFPFIPCWKFYSIKRWEHNYWCCIDISNPKKNNTDQNMLKDPASSKHGKHEHILKEVILVKRQVPSAFEPPLGKSIPMSSSSTKRETIISSQREVWKITCKLKTGPYIICLQMVNILYLQRFKWILPIDSLELCLTIFIQIVKHCNK